MVRHYKTTDIMMCFKIQKLSVNTSKLQIISKPHESTALKRNTFWIFSMRFPQNLITVTASIFLTTLILSLQFIPDDGAEQLARWTKENVKHMALKAQKVCTCQKGVLCDSRKRQIADMKIIHVMFMGYSNRLLFMLSSEVWKFIICYNVYKKN